MKVSINIAQYYTSVDLKSIPHTDLVKKIGTQLGAVEDTKDWSVLYEGVLVVRIVSCEKHPNADKLSVCMVDDGGVMENVERDSAGYVQVVCGAPNVIKDAWAAWIPPGVSVPSTREEAEPFVLEARELRGETSNGMLASLKELAISDDHNGILLIDSDEVGRAIAPGESLLDFYLLDDFVVDCENKMFTHRPDCFGVLGVARELVGISGQTFTSPEWYTTPVPVAQTGALPIVSSNPIPAKVPRFMLQTMDQATITSSPIWLQAYLGRVGIKPINNLVDHSNYFMHLTAQPTHIFDYDKVVALCGEGDVTLYPRMATKGEKLQLLNGKEILLSEDDIVIAVSPTKSVALAGIMGGFETEVDASTKRIIIECATFDMYTIRRSSMRHGLFTDAVTRYNKGQSPLQNDKVLAKMTQNLQEAYGLQPGVIFDSGEPIFENVQSIETTAGFINKRLGSEFDADSIASMLRLVEITAIIDEETNGLTVFPPFWRTDLQLQEDLVEEIGRLYGYDRLPVVLPVRTTKPAAENVDVQYKQLLRNTLSRHGANEVLTHSFVHGDLLRNTGTDPEKWAYHIRNAISPDLQYYRTSLIPSLLSKVHQNIKAQAGSSNNVFALFEIGKAHVKGHFEEDEKSLPKQMQRLAFVIAGDDKSIAGSNDSAYYLAKKYLDLLLGDGADYHALDETEATYPIASAYQIGRSALVQIGEDEQTVGVIGEFSDSTARALKLPKYCAGFEIDLDLVIERVRPKSYTPLSLYPSVQQDITFEVPENMNWSTLYGFVKSYIHVQSASNNMSYEIEPLTIYQQEHSEKKRISFRVTLTHHEITLRTSEVAKLLDLVSEHVSGSLQATRI